MKLLLRSFYDPFFNRNSAIHSRLPGDNRLPVTILPRLPENILSRIHIPDIEPNDLSIDYVPKR